MLRLRRFGEKAKNGRPDLGGTDGVGVALEHCGEGEL